MLSTASAAIHPTDPLRASGEQPSSSETPAADKLPVHVPDRQSSKLASRDWTGNTEIHQYVCGYDPDPSKLSSMLAANPRFGSYTNEQGRIPLHYALDRSNPRYEIVGILVKHYPEGVSVCDCEGNTSLDLAEKWESSDAILLLLLSANPALDMEFYLELKYGALYYLYCSVKSCAACFFSDGRAVSRRRSSQFSRRNSAASYRSESFVANGPLSFIKNGSSLDGASTPHSTELASDLCPASHKPSFAAQNISMQLKQANQPSSPPPAVTVISFHNSMNET